MEVELKIKITDLVKVEKRIKELGAKYLGEVVEEDIYVNFDCEDGCCRNFAETDEAIRLRRTGDKCILTYKGPRTGRIAKVREEIEIAIEACEKMLKLLLLIY
jgi:adenylate cyclase class 2